MLERLKLDPQTHIYLESLSPGERHKHIYMATPHSVLIIAKSGTFARKKNGATDLKLNMQTQLDSTNNMGWVPPGHASSTWYVMLKMLKMVLLENTWT